MNSGAGFHALQQSADCASPHPQAGTESTHCEGEGSMEYESFIRRKLSCVPPTGITGELRIPLSLFDHQRALVQWALRRGRAAIFADTGLGKSRMQLAWASEVLRHIGRPVLILAPLAVAAQTVAEGCEIGISVRHVRDQSGVTDTSIYITNYDRLHLFDASAFGALVLDESSCIKHHTAKTFAHLCEAFRNTPYKLCATATPAPNDWTELGTHAEFLGICTRAEMLAEYFIHDGAETQVWRLKGHARAQFWRWVSTWGAMVRKPSDLGFDDSRYELPPLAVHQHTIVIPNAAERVGMLFAMEAQTLSERRGARKESTEDRVRACAELVNADDERWLVWCDMNAESEMLTRAIRGAVEVKGADDPEHKERALTEFAAGNIRALVSKPSIAGWGMNFQRCARIAFVGVTDSWESYYQAVRRCWRFGQSRQVDVHIFASDLEGAVVANLRRKEADALAMADALSAETRESVMREVRGLTRQTNNYNATRTLSVPAWLRSEMA